jgi:hypothetical protein
MSKNRRSLEILVIFKRSLTEARFIFIYLQKYKKMIKNVLVSSCLVFIFSWVIFEENINKMYFNDRSRFQ